MWTVFEPAETPGWVDAIVKPHAMAKAHTVAQLNVDLAREDTLLFEPGIVFTKDQHESVGYMEVATMSDLTADLAALRAAFAAIETLEAFLANPGGSVATDGAFLIVKTLEAVLSKGKANDGA